MIAILIFSVGISFAYILLISRYIKGWNSINEFLPEESSSDLNITVIIAFRNEEKNLPFLFQSLKEQSYPKSAFDIIFVDDHSEDNSAILVRDFVFSGANARLFNMEGTDEGKKKALTLAASEARGKLLLFTDADCIPGKDWIKTIVSRYHEDKPVLIASPVVINPGSSFFSRFQSLEFFSLTGGTAGSFGIRNPIMVNGANLAVEKESFVESIDYLKNNTPSGDDIFLLIQLKKKYKERLVFLKSINATVIVNPHSNLNSFLHQRLRWTSKSKYYRDKSLIVSALIVLLINLWLLNCFIMAFFSTTYIIIGGAIFLLKSIIDFIFLRKVLKFFKYESLLKFFVLSQFLYFLYISFTGVTGNFIPSKWKGRSVR
jgi:cellulose synthase/poly-beta-1,6-N-acetylglucosamine synthase-like glycosyltransferase